MYSDIWKHVWVVSWGGGESGLNSLDSGEAWKRKRECGGKRLEGKAEESRGEWGTDWGGWK